MNKHINWEVHCICEDKVTSVGFPIFFFLRSPYTDRYNRYYYISILGIHDFDFFNSYLTCKSQSKYTVLPISHFEQFPEFIRTIYLLKLTELGKISSEQLGLHVRRILMRLRKYKIMCRYKNSENLTD